MILDYLDGVIELVQHEIMMKWNQNTIIFVEENKFENVIRKILAILLLPKYVACCHSVGDPWSKEILVNLPIEFTA